MGVSYLLDSHAFYWLVDARFAPPAHVTAALEAGRIHVSAVSSYELARKQALGKFDAPRMLPGWMPAVRRLGASELPLSTEHALTAATLDWEHRDPFDRLLAGQAIVEGLTLVTADPAFETAPGVTLLRW
ncbi:MAG: type II toxin-antitoxin system VapC family toxin [Nocardioidaceae bacterium]